MEVRGPTQSTSQGAFHCASMGKVRAGDRAYNGRVAVDIRNDWDFSSIRGGDTHGTMSRYLQIIAGWKTAGRTRPHAPRHRWIGFVQSDPETRIQSLRLWEKKIGARSIGMPTFDRNNGRLMEDGAGASIIDVLARDGKAPYPCFEVWLPQWTGELTVLSHGIGYQDLTLEG